ncbi:protein sprouty, partial [Cephus cinctus]|uniref:Protein sprouty n=1 Tax=Cephus cinctus TaxID=211228 RepID=A0AAJ7BXH2_CEPCN
KCGSVDTLDCPPPPALPPRRPPWPPNNLNVAATIRNLDCSTSSNLGRLSSTASPGSSTGHHHPALTHQTQKLAPPPPPPLTPPQYPAPPRPPSRNGGDEARVARAESGRGPSSFANGTASPRSLPPRAGWAVRATGSLSSSAFPAPSGTTPSAAGGQTSPRSSVVGQWANSDSISSSSSAATSQSGFNVKRHLADGASGWSDRLELRGVPMSQNASPPSRPPSSSSSISSTSALPRVHGHDHNRPLPPPRLPEGTGTLVPLTAPLTPLSTSSFRSRTSLVHSTTNSGTQSSHSSPQNARNQHLQTPGVASPVSAGSPTTISAAIGANTTTTGSAGQAPRSPVGEVTLAVPRPDGERAVNEYVETPFRPSVAQNPGQKCTKNERRHHQKVQAHHHQLHQHANHHQSLNHQHHHQNHLQSSSPTNTVTKQPVSFTKEPANSISSGSLGPRAEGLSIMCDFCGKCRCESCREPPPLPSRWLCDNSCFCSAETALDYASCLCCVKGLFYHCGDSGSGVDGEGGGSCADEPCSCTGSRKSARWACLGALTLVLPCLLCYWPFKGCVALCEACYARHASQGCRCDPSTLGRHLGNAVVRDSRDPEKRLLDPVTPEL